MWYKSADQKIGIPTVYESWIKKDDKPRGMLVQYEKNS